MTERLNIILQNIPNCKVFADVGCDHGYISKAMLDENKCEFVLFSDISKECLKKAEILLGEYVSLNKAKGVVSNGFDNLSEFDVALIAGMGGEEIICILKKADFLPDALILQPMKNVDKVREYVIANGYKIIKDFVFEDLNKFYDLIVLEKGQDKLEKEEIIFGRTNLQNKNSVFIKRLTKEKATLLKLLEEDLPSIRKNEIKEQLELIEKYV